MVSRRDLLKLPGLVLLPEIETARTVHRVTVSGPEPLARLASRWKFGAVRRVKVRPEAGWWPTPEALPDRWQAWLELWSGDAVHVVARGVSSSRPGHPVTAELVRLLTAEG